jgi:hypothetical protein
LELFQYTELITVSYYNLAMEGKMKKLSHQTIAVSFALLTLFVSPLTFATSAVLNKTMQASSGAGCMGCHQNETIQPNDALEKKADDLRLSNKATTKNEARKPS